MNVPYVARIQRVVCPSPDLISSLHRHFRQPRPPNLCRGPCTCHEGFRDECVALEEVGVHDERRTPAERDLRMHPYLSGARMSIVVVPSLRELTLFHRLSAPPYPPPPERPLIVTASGLFIPPRVGRNQILVSRSSVIRSSKLTTRTCFPQSGSVLFRAVEIREGGRENVKMHSLDTDLSETGTRLLFYYCVNL